MFAEFSNNHVQIYFMLVIMRGWDLVAGLCASDAGDYCLGIAGALISLVFYTIWVLYGRLVGEIVHIDPLAFFYLLFYQALAYLF
jgi:uncharacterized membrane protein